MESLINKIDNPQIKEGDRNILKMSSEQIGNTKKIQQRIRRPVTKKDSDSTDLIPSNTLQETNYSNKTKDQLLDLCKERGIKGYHGKKKEILISLLSPSLVEQKQEQEQETPIIERVIHDDLMNVLPTLESDSAQIILADPPYNIGKDFGNKSDKQPMEDYLKWCEDWIKECIRILKPNGTMFIYGFSEILALILSKIPYHIHRRWIIWHYTNKNVASLNFWQRSHESILVLWKEDKVFHRDEIRESYTDGFLKGAAGKERKSTKGRFSKGDKKTTYTAHPNGALPRDVIKIPALAGGAGMKERVNHPTQKPLLLCEKLLMSCKQPPTEGYVLIPFAGSGSECVAAKKMGLPFIGIEINEEYIKLIANRLSSLLVPTEQQDQQEQQEQEEIDQDQKENEEE